MNTNDMIKGLVRAAELSEQGEGRGELWDDTSRKALARARELGWGGDKTGGLSDPPPPSGTKIVNGQPVTTEGETPVPVPPIPEPTLEEKVEKLWAFVGDKFVTSGVYGEVIDVSPLASMLRKRIGPHDAREIASNEVAQAARRSSLRQRIGDAVSRIADRIRYGKRSPFADLEQELGRTVDSDEIEPLNDTLNNGIFK